MQILITILAFLFFSLNSVAQPEYGALSGTQEASFSELHIKPFFERAIDQNSQFILAAGVVSSVITRSQDEALRRDWKDHHYMSEDASKVGDILGSGLAGGVTLGLQYFYDDQSDHWISHGRGLVWGTIASTILKAVVGRPRPGNSENRHSFPSGHTTTAFTTATSLAYAYGWKAAVMAYPLATFVGLSRISDDVHWASDVVAGAFLGYWAARASFYSTQDIKDEKRRSVFMPMVGGGTIAINWTYSY